MRTMCVVHSTHDDKIREKASAKSNLHPVARPTSPKIGAHTGFM
jgi:hypothetical protein